MGASETSVARMTSRASGGRAVAAVVGAVGWVVAIGASAFGLRAAEGGFEFFEQRVRPVLAEHCAGCHGSGHGQPKGGLRLDGKAGWEKGGANGPAIVPGKPAESLLVRAVRREPGVKAMPPEGEGRRPLSAEEARALEEWVAMGAPDPRDGRPLVKGGGGSRPGSGRP